MDELKDHQDHLYQLVDILGQKTGDEALELLRRLHQSRRPEAILTLIEEGDLLLQTRVTGHLSEFTLPTLKAIDELALAESKLSLSAMPWTQIAPDGIVSYLLWSFFEWDDATFLPFVDGEGFLDDYRQADPKQAQFCSPLLVSLTSVRTFHHGRPETCLVDVLELRLMQADKLRLGNCHMCTSSNGD